MKSVYKNIVIIGYGKIAIKILEYVNDFSKDMGYQLLFIEHEKQLISVMQQVCADAEVAYERIVENKKLEDRLVSIADKTLIISANNNYIFPQSVLNNEKLVIINFHNALLPNYPGRNAPSWAMYNGEKETGITWHFVNNEIDAGNIIAQSSCVIGENDKAYQLTKRLMDLSYDCFCNFFEDLITNNVTGIAQKKQAYRKIYLSKDIPGNGRFDIEKDTGEYIYRLLRSTDYGVGGIFPTIKTFYDGRTVEILKYNVMPADDIQEAGYIYLKIDSMRKLRLKYKEIE